MRRTLSAIGMAVFAVCLVIATNPSGAAVAAPTGSPPLPIGNIFTGLATEITAPTSMPPGSDNWNCHVSAQHPYPVVLVHGTIANQALSWQALSPMLANAGYCVYGFNYGATSLTFGHVFGLAPIQQSAAELSAFIARVLAATGAAKVDIVGHSQGGMMPRYYLKFLGGAPKVNLLVGLAPSNYGTNLDGFTTAYSPLAAAIPGLSFTTFGAPSFDQQFVGSSFLAALNHGGDTVPGVKYVVIESRYDEVVTPYTNAFLTGAGAQNILLQDQCPTDFTEHIGIIYDPVALQDVMNAVGADNPAFRPTCSLVLPLLSG
ncbi:MAG TPA: alpha/beta fold hydrolase [Acidimicrobiales bacterium]|nr:alpha/beta fold hydrolase [Acidimicrobiales bacterium]